MPIWTNTDYARYLIDAGDRMLEHYGEADAPRLSLALDNAKTCTEAWGTILWQNPDQAAKSPSNDVQDLLNYIAAEHRNFDGAIEWLQDAMRRLSQRG